MRKGKGWHGEPLRHSRAKRFGKAGGSYADAYKTKKAKITVKNHSKTLDFPKGKGNNIHTAITVPSTTLADKPISKKEHERRAKEVEKFLSEKFGGYTEIKGGGGWVSDEKGLIKEPVLIVHSYTDDTTYRKMDLEIQAFLEKKKKEWGQESMAYEFEESMHFI